MFTVEPGYLYIGIMRALRAHYPLVSAIFVSDGLWTLMALYGWFSVELGGQVIEGKPLRRDPLMPGLSFRLRLR